MNSQTLTAVAAMSAAVISLINVALTSFFVQRQASVRWVRELLPDVIMRFTEAAFHYEREVFETDWRKLTSEEQSHLGLDEFVKASALCDQLEAFASPKTIETARALLHSIEGIRSTSYEAIASGDFEVWHPKRRIRYWAYAEAHYAFIAAARGEMGLKPPPVPPGLAAQRSTTSRPH